MIIVYSSEGCVFEVSVSSEFLSQYEGDIVSAIIPTGVSSFLINPEKPKEPIESWYIEDGEIKVDQQKLLGFNRSQMPRLTPIEFDIKLNNAGLYDAVQELIKDDFNLRIAYTRATFFSRTDPFIDQARVALGLTNEQVDAMWAGQE